MKILYFGDVVGRVGRRGVAKVLAEWKQQYAPDLVLANAENIAHGVGITPKTIQELMDAGVDFFTSGNHVWDKPAGDDMLKEADAKVIRPYNYGSRRSGKGVKELEINGQKVLIVNLQGQAFMHDQVDNPFHAANRIFLDYAPKNYEAIFVDLHAEATSEKVAMGWHLDGRASVLVGSHTHVPTADARILPKGLGYITDVGMNGPRDSVIGVEKEAILRRFLEEEKKGFSYAEEGICDINALLVEVEGRKTTSLQLLQTTVEV